jgi:biopolymer transport protein ExbD
MNFQADAQSGENEPTFNLTPLIDVLFLLVIFLAVATSFRVHRGVSVQLPQAQGEQVMEEPSTVIAVLTEAGEILLDGKPVAMEGVEGFLERRQKEAPVSLFVLQADEMARHGQAVALMDAARQTGVARLAIATRPKKDDDVDRSSGGDE